VHEAVRTAGKQRSTRAYTVIDPRTMGRPVHLLGGFANQLRDDVTDYLRTRINRRYNAGFQIDAVSFIAAPPDSRRWLTYCAGGGHIRFAVDRALLLCLLRYRYGSPLPNVSASTDNESALPAPLLDEPETATEERLYTMLGQQFAELAVRRIEAVQRVPLEAAASVAFAEAATRSSCEGDWLLRLTLRETRCNVSGELLLRISEVWMTRLLQALTPNRDRSPQKQMTAIKPFPARLQLTLRARLLEKEVPLGTLLDLRPGDVLPISLGDADVLIGDSRLFTASVAEHHGKLCLTSLADVD
jgi:flagellar motor switch protein FliM